MPDRIRPLLLAARGFGGVSLLRFLQQMPQHMGRRVDYVVRVKGSIHIQTGDGYRGALREYPLHKMRYVLLPGVRYCSDDAGVVGLVLGCCVLLLAGLRVLWLFRRRVCLWGRLGLLRLGVECYLAGHTGTAARMAGLARPRKWVRVGVWRALKSLLWVRDGVKRKRRPFSRTSTGVGPTGFG